MFRHFDFFFTPRIAKSKASFLVLESNEKLDKPAQEASEAPAQSLSSFFEVTRANCRSQEVVPPSCRRPPRRFPLFLLLHLMHVESLLLAPFFKII